MDLGCGNGPLTLTLADRWPQARIVGVDSSPQMLAPARELDAEGRVEWVEADLSEWDIASLGEAPDVIVTNATLQWVPGHRELLGSWVAALAAGGWFAMQVPSNFEAPSHRLMREAAEAHPAAERLRPGLARVGVAEPADYVEDLSGLGCDVDAWETTYQHILDPEGRPGEPGARVGARHRASPRARRPDRREGAHGVPRGLRRTSAARHTPAGPLG